MGPKRLNDTLSLPEVLIPRTVILEVTLDMWPASEYNLSVCVCWGGGVLVVLFTFCSFVQDLKTLR